VKQPKTKADDPRNYTKSHELERPFRAVSCGFVDRVSSSAGS